METVCAQPSQACSMPDAPCWAFTRHPQGHVLCVQPLLIAHFIHAHTPACRSVGGMRASIYNAMPEEGVNKLVAFMKVQTRLFSSLPAACTGLVWLASWLSAAVGDHCTPCKCSTPPSKMGYLVGGQCDAGSIVDCLWLPVPMDTGSCLPPASMAPHFKVCLQDFASSNQ